MNKSNDQPIRFRVVKLTPWSTSGRRDLADRFFSEIAAKVGNRRKELGIAFLDLGQILAAQLGPIGPELVKQLRHRINCCGDLDPMATLHAELGRQKHWRLLVIIDDVDRLPDSEIRRLFGVIAALANLPNVTYLLVFDRSVVARALRKMQATMSGEQYLSKIVQQSFDLPQPGPRVLLREFKRLVAPSLEIAPMDPQFPSVLASVMGAFLGTMRDVKRLASAIRVGLSLAGGEVAPLDFAVLEAVRMFAPGLYDCIRSNPDHFTGVSGDPGNEKGQELLRKECTKLLKGVHTEALSKLALFLFPRLQGESKRALIPEWTRASRLCSPQKFPFYFRLNVPTGDVSNDEVRQMLKPGTDPKSLEHGVRRLLAIRSPEGGTAAGVFLLRALSFTADIEESSIPHILTTLFAVGDDVLAAEGEDDQEYAGAAADWLVDLTLALLQRLKDSKRGCEALKSAIVGAQGVTTVGISLCAIAAVNDTLGLPSGQELMSLKREAAFRIRAVANAGGLVPRPGLTAVLRLWELWSPDDFQTWLGTQASDEAAWRDLCGALRDSMPIPVRVRQGDPDFIPFGPEDLQRHRSEATQVRSGEAKPELTGAQHEATVDKREMAAGGSPED
jgi:hypothetical protein